MDAVPQIQGLVQIVGTARLWGFWSQGRQSPLLATQSVYPGKSGFLPPGYLLRLFRYRGPRRRGGAEIVACIAATAKVRVFVCA